MIRNPIRVDWWILLVYTFIKDITSMNLSYGVDYNHSFWGGYYDIDIFTRTRNDRRRTLDIFVQKIWFDDLVYTHLQISSPFASAREEWVTYN